jgi:ABC-type microcin C transport system duplicated ATPase subunit YejF
VATAATQRMSDIRGKTIGTVFQDPMSPLTPVYTVGYQRQGQDFAGAHEAFLADELARRVRRQSGSVQGPVGGGARLLRGRYEWQGQSGDRRVPE